MLICFVATNNFKFALTLSRMNKIYGGIIEFISYELCER